LIEESKRWQARGGGLYLAVRYPPIRRQLAQFHVPREVGRDHIFRRKMEMFEACCKPRSRYMCDMHNAYFPWMPESASH